MNVERAADLVLHLYHQGVLEYLGRRAFFYALDLTDADISSIKSSSELPNHENPIAQTLIRLKDLGEPDAAIKFGKVQSGFSEPKKPMSESELELYLVSFAEWYCRHPECLIPEKLQG